MEEHIYTRNDEVMSILNKFKPKIKKCLRNTSYQYREDLEQEIKLKVIEKLDDVEFNNPPSFWDFFNEV